VTGPLAGCTVIVTRPAAQAGPFIERAHAAGARCIAFPTLLIEPLEPGPDVAGEIAQRGWDWVVYTSVNAVDCAAQLFGRLPIAQHGVAAVGLATARALERRGVHVTLRPESANSEGLLAAPDWQDVAGRSVLLVKGSGGRDLLQATLTDRGAEVRVVEVYRRAPAVPDGVAVAAIESALGDSSRRLVVAVTSAEVLANLLELLPDAVATRLREAALLVPGERVAVAAHAAGWRGPVLRATTAEDAAMLAALTGHVAGVSSRAC
jgi:uroporphyrinogen-III synthase